MTPNKFIILGGHFQNCNFQFSEQHPLIIPENSKFTELLIMREQQNLCNSRVSDTFTQICEKFCILKDRQMIKSCINKCFICWCYKVKPSNQTVAQLPAERLYTESTFEIITADFAGPYIPKTWIKSLLHYLSVLWLIPSI